MVRCPFKNGDSITLKQQYVIVSLLEETQKYWLLEAVQIPTQLSVLIKIYINERFASIAEAEDAWKNEVLILQSKDDDQHLPIKFIESGSLAIAEEKLFVIVLNYVEGSEGETAKAEIAIDDDEMESEDESVITDVIQIPEIKTEKEREKVYGAAPTPIKDIDETSTKRKKTADKPSAPPTSGSIAVPPTPSKPSVPSTAPVPSTPITDELLKKSVPYKSKKKPSYSEEKQAPMDARSLTLVDEKDYLKHISMEYFDRMNPQNYYPLTLNISDILQDEIAPEVNILTGERKIQAQSQLDAKLKSSIVTIRPTLPGCSVVPREIKADFDRETDEVTFYVTPGVKGDIVGHIVFINEGKVFHTTDFKAKVVDPNYARVVAFYGILASFVPKILSMLGMDIGLGATISSLSTNAIAVVGDMNIASLIAIGGVLPVVIASLLVRQRLKPKSKRVQYRLVDFRLKGL